MPLGLQCWDTTGRLTVDTTSKLILFSGLITTSGAGSMSVPEFAYGIPFARPFGASGTDQFFVANLTISGTTLSWGGAMRIIYGIYG